jgi:hypothetical protein
MVIAEFGTCSVAVWSAVGRVRAHADDGATVTVAGRASPARLPKHDAKLGALGSVATAGSGIAPLPEKTSGRELVGHRTTMFPHTKATGGPPDIAADIAGAAGTTVVAARAAPAGANPKQRIPPAVVSRILVPMVCPRGGGGDPK